MEGHWLLPRDGCAPEPLPVGPFCGQCRTQFNSPMLRKNRKKWVVRGCPPEEKEEEDQVGTAVGELQPLGPAARRLFSRETGEHCHSLHVVLPDYPCNRPGDLLRDCDRAAVAGNVAQLAQQYECRPTVRVDHEYVHGEGEGELDRKGQRKRRKTERGQGQEKAQRDPQLGSEGQGEGEGEGEWCEGECANLPMPALEVDPVQVALQQHLGKLDGHSALQCCYCREWHRSPAALD